MKCFKPISIPLILMQILKLCNSLRCNCFINNSIICVEPLFFLQVRLESFELFLELSISVQANKSTVFVLRIYSYYKFCFKISEGIIYL